MNYLLKEYHQEWSNNFIKQTIVVLNNQEFNAFKEEHRMAGDNCWYGESDCTNLNRDENYYSYYYLLPEEVIK